MNIGDKAKQVLATVAPLLGTALGGPLGGIAGTLVASALGTKPGDDKAATTALLSASPEQLVALQKANNDFHVQMQQLQVTEDQLQYADVASAREREEGIKDWTPTVLAYGVTIGFFGILAWMLVRGVPKESDVLMVMLGSLGTAWTAMVGYYFGSSIGARKSLDTLSTIAKQP